MEDLRGGMTESADPQRRRSHLRRCQCCTDLDRVIKPEVISFGRLQALDSKEEQLANVVLRDEIAT